MELMTFTHDIEGLLFNENKFSFRNIKKLKSDDYFYHHFKDTKHKCMNDVVFDNDGRQIVYHTKPRFTDWIEKLENDVTVIGYTIGKHAIPIKISGYDVKIQTDFEVFFKQDIKSKVFEDTIFKPAYIFLLGPLRLTNFTMLSDDELKRLNKTQLMSYDLTFKIVSSELEMLKQIQSWCDDNKGEMIVDYGNENIERMISQNLVVIN